MNFFRFLAVFLVISSSFVLYYVKEVSHATSFRIKDLESRISDEKAMIDVLRAEWSYLERPDRLQDLSVRYLDLSLMEIDQIIAVDDLKEHLLRSSESEEGLVSDVGGQGREEASMPL